MTHAPGRQANQQVRPAATSAVVRKSTRHGRVGVKRPIITNSEATPKVRDLRQTQP